MNRPVRRAAMLPCQVVRERDWKLLARWTIDLSNDGMQVATDAMVLTGEPVIVSFKSPFCHAWIDAEAFVARVLHGRRAHDRKRALGVHFDHMDTSSRHHLAEVVSWFNAARSRSR